MDLGAYELTHYFVNGSATGTTHDGKTWATAFTDLQKALTTTTQDTEVWVAGGTYKPNTTITDRTASFRLASGLMIYGSFSGTEALFSGRLFKPSTLSGDLKGDDQANFVNYGENSYHVITANAVDSSTILDSFTVVDGNANGPVEDSLGGGMLILGSSSPYLNNINFSNNSAAGQGGGLYNEKGDVHLYSVGFVKNYSAKDGGGFYTAGGNPYLSNPYFLGNTAVQNGGGLVVAGGSPFLSGGSFWSNPATNGGAVAVSGGIPTLLEITFNYNSAADGGAIYNNGGAPLVEDSVFFYNTASDSGGGFYNTTSCLTLTNVTMTANSAAVHGGGMFNDQNVNPLIQNSILWGDGPEELYNKGQATPTVRYSLVKGCKPGGVWKTPCGTDAGGNVADGDPQFVNSTQGNLRIFFNSPAIDAGNDALISALPVDILRDARKYGAHVDLGAYELTHVYVDSRATGLNNGTSWANAFTSLQSALTIYNGSDVEIWVAKGTFKPTQNPDRTASFVLISGHMVFGGFAGNETALSQRSIPANLTLLSGDLNGDDGANFVNNSDNSLSVVRVSYTDISPILDGVTISGGNNNQNLSSGGGVLVNSGDATLANLTITGNTAGSGGGLAFLNSSVFLTNTTVNGNTATAKGGGLYSEISSPNINRVTFSGNSAAKGGAILQTGTDCVFWKR